MLGALYQALLDAHASEESARRAAEEVAAYRERIPLTRQTIWRMVRDGRFPPPIRLTTSRTVWRLSTVLAWIAYRESHPFTTRSYFGNVPRK